MNRVLKVMGFIVLALVLLTTQGLAFDWPWAKEGEEGVLSLQGSTTVFPIAQRVAEEFMNRHPDVNVTVRGGGSGVGIAALLDGSVDIAMASRPIKTKELKAAREKGINPVATVIARDGIAVIVHPTNPVDGLTLSQVRAIYTGRINRWNEVGGKPETIVVISRDTASGTFEAFKELALKGAKERPDALMLASNRAVATTVAQTPGGIGYVGMGYLSPEVKALKVDGMSPNPEVVKSGRYPLARSLFFYTDGSPGGLTKEFIDFILSPAGQRIAEELGFIPVR